MAPGYVRPWYAAVWAEAAVLGRLDDAPSRVGRSRHAARDNPIASAIVERPRRWQPVTGPPRERAATFAGLGCPYQEARTRTLIAA